MKIEMCEQLLEMLQRLEAKFRRNPEGSLRRMIIEVEEAMSLKWALERQTIASRWTTNIGLEGPRRKTELQELLDEWLREGRPGPLYGTIRVYARGPADYKFREILGMDQPNNSSAIETPLESGDSNSELTGTLQLPARELGAIAIQAGKLGISTWKYVEMLVLREARKALARFEEVADVEDVMAENPYPLHGTPFRYVDPVEPVGVDDWEALK